jgi:CRP-like cAMP-binding protein
MNRESFSADRRLVCALERRSQPVDCAEGRTLFVQGETPKGIYILLRGEATLVMTSHAGQIIMSVQASSGSLLGLPGVVGKEPYTLTAMARKGSEIRFVTREDFEHILEEEPRLHVLVLQVLAAEVRSARQALSENLSYTRSSPGSSAPATQCQRQLPSTSATDD